jgi:hypothetical protein
MPEFHESDTQFVYFSGKRAEEVGFEKFHQRQAKLQGIRVLVLDHMQIRPRGPLDDQEHIAEICSDITDLDLSGNLFEDFHEILNLCGHLPKLRVLTLDGNRFAVHLDQDHIALPSVQALGLSRTLVDPAEFSSLISSGNITFPSLKSLNLANNEYRGPFRLQLPPTLSSVNLSGNEFASLSDLIDLGVSCPLLRTLVLKQNQISAVHSDESQITDSALPVAELDLSYNAISSFTFFNDMNSTTFPQLKHLRVTGNPLYKSLVSAEGKPLAAEDGYMLTIARLPQLKYLNYSKITEKERLNAETYYLGQIAAELARAPPGEHSTVLARHPRYKALCKEYGEPTIQRQLAKDELDPNSLAAKLVTVTFTLSDGLLPQTSQRSWTQEIPKSFNIYAVLGMVGKRLGLRPLELRLILESNENDPVGKESGYDGPGWWDSGDDEAETTKDRWVKRQVELVTGTSSLGTFIEAAAAHVRVVLRRGDV